MAGSPEALTNALETCNAVMLGLGARRFVIVRRGERSKLCHTDAPAKRVRDLRPGDEVIYKGQVHTERSLNVYE
jgi:hypothetical protein